MNTQDIKRLPPWLLFTAGAILVIQFAALGAWQVSRGLEKHASRALLNDQSTFTHFSTGDEIRAYQSIEVDGRFVSEKQFLLDKIILNDRFGYNVLTALELAEGEPLLIVNRGWTQRSSSAPQIDVGEEPRAVHGRVGSLPKPGMGEAIATRDTWPQVAVRPTIEDLEQSLGRELQPFVLLMDPEDDNGFVRHWVPEEMGPGKHFGYALQWFAMGAALLGILIWNFRRRRSTA